MLPPNTLLNRKNVRDIRYNPLIKLFIFGYSEDQTNAEEMFYFIEFPKHHKEKPQISFILSGLKTGDYYYFHMKYGKEQHFRVASSISMSRPSVHRIIRNKEADPKDYFTVEQLQYLIKQLVPCSEELSYKLAEFCRKITLEGKGLMKRDVTWINELHREKSKVQLDVSVRQKGRVVYLDFGNISTTQYAFPSTIRHIAKLLDIRSREVLKAFIKKSLLTIEKTKQEDI